MTVGSLTLDKHDDATLNSTVIAINRAKGSTSGLSLKTDFWWDKRTQTVAVRCFIVRKDIVMFLGCQCSNSDFPNIIQSLF